VGQVIKKRSGNSQYDRWESGDSIIGESRMKFLVERYPDYGLDGVPGNASSVAGAAGADGIVGTIDDLVSGTTGSNPATNGYNPVTPAYPLYYKYRIVSVSQINTK